MPIEGNSEQIHSHRSASTNWTGKKCDRALNELLKGHSGHGLWPLTAYFLLPVSITWAEATVAVNELLLGAGVLSMLNARQNRHMSQSRKTRGRPTWPPLQLPNNRVNLSTWPHDRHEM